MTIQFSAQLAPVDGLSQATSGILATGPRAHNTVEHTFELAGEFDVSLNVVRRGAGTIRCELS